MSEVVFQEILNNRLLALEASVVKLRKEVARLEKDKKDNDKEDKR